MDAYTIDMPASEWPAKTVSMNQLRGQSKNLHHRTAPWREYGMQAAARALRDGRIRLLPDGVRLWFEVRQPDNRRRDTPNLMPTAKAIVDGIADAGVIRDDMDGILEGPLIRRVYPNGPARIRLRFEVIGTEAIGMQDT